MRLVSEPVAAQFTGITPTYLRQRRSRGLPPAWVKGKTGAVAYDVAALEQFMAKQGAAAALQLQQLEMTGKRLLAARRPDPFLEASA